MSPTTLTLSGRRADSVMNYLVLKVVYREYSMASAFGESQPVNSIDTREGRQNNRRVELFAME